MIIMENTSRMKSRRCAIEKLYSLEFNEPLNYEGVDDFAKELIDGVINNKERIDDIISNCLFNYTIKRLNVVDLEIIRVATFELLEKKIASAIIINEAIELTKIYTNLDDDKAKAFNNKLLDNISKYIDGK
jgi:N utilization substance protein B